MASSSPKVAVVTGGSRGIGLAIAAGLVEQGITVAFTGVNPDHLRRAQETLAKQARNGAEVLSIAADVREVLKDPAIATRLEATGQVVAPGSATEFAAALDRQRATVAEVAKVLGINAATQ